MTPEQINKTIAEACGWTHLEQSGIMLPDPWYLGYPPKGAIVGKKRRTPDYYHNLNACHDMEHYFDVKWASGDADAIYVGWTEYWIHLVKATVSYFDVELPSDLRAVLHATAPQRCEAFLRTLGKWVEEVKPV